MEPFWKGIAGVLIVVFLGLSVGKKEFSALLSMAGCCLVFGVAAVYLEPVVAFFRELDALTGQSPEMLGTLLKCAGAALVAELAALLCADSGNGALAKSVKLLGTGAVLYASLPAFRSVLELIQKLLGGFG